MQLPAITVILSRLTATSKHRQARRFATSVGAVSFEIGDTAEIEETIEIQNIY
jgi:hypothetical protein